MFIDLGPQEASGFGFRNEIEYVLGHGELDYVRVIATVWKLDYETRGFGCELVGLRATGKNRDFEARISITAYEDEGFAEEGTETDFWVE